MVQTDKILIVDDEADILELLEYHLTKEGYEVVTAKNGNEALTQAKKYAPSLIILDSMMPYKNGHEVCNILRLDKSFNNTIIVFLTAVTNDDSHIKALELGADDYLNKPISPKVLISKIQSLLKRKYYNSDTNEANNIVTVGSITINIEQFLLIKDGEEIFLPRKEFQLFSLLASKPGKVFLRNEILEKVWGNEIIVGDRTIDVHIRKIRSKLNFDKIVTVKGVGYKLEI